MHVLTVAYGHPRDPAAFDEHYRTTHRPLAASLPGLVGLTARHCTTFDGSRPPYHLVAELSFPDQESLVAALRSPEGQAGLADLEHFADGGTTVFVQHD